MEGLTVLYDADCGFCVTCRWWLADQPAFVPLDFLAVGSPEAQRRFPTLGEAVHGKELTVVDEEGGVYTGPPAFLMCLWALEDWRELSLRLGSPVLQPLARRVFEMISANRGRISRWLHLKTEDELAAHLE